MLMENRLIEFMAKVGGGSRVSKDLTYEEANDAMNAILDGAYHPVTFGSFTLAVRWKPETPAEMAAFADAMNERLSLPSSTQKLDGLVNSAGAYDGKARTVNFGIAAALTAASAGVPMLLHGSENIPAKRGMTPFHILNELGIDTEKSVAGVLQDIQTCGIGYLHQPVVNPAVHALLEHRRQVGKRTFINSIEPLINPYQSAVHIGGFFHRPFGELMGKAIAGMKTGYPRALMIAGIEGSEEIKPGRSLIVEVKEEKLNSHYIEPSEFGMNACEDDINSKASGNLKEMAKESAGLLREFLNQSAPEAYTHLVLLNAGVRIYANGKTNSIQEGYKLAHRTYSDNNLKNTFQNWKQRE